MFNFARARAGAGPWLPDPAVALVCALALRGKVNIIIPSAILIALARVPASLADPLASTGALLFIAWLIREARRFLARDYATVVFCVASLASLAFIVITRTAAAARGDYDTSLIEPAGAALATSVFTLLLMPALRLLPFTRNLLDRRFGE